MEKDDELDKLFEEAALLVLDRGVASTSLLQRYLALGYNKAYRILNQLEKFGVVGNDRGFQPREVLIKNKEDLQLILQKL